MGDFHKAFEAIDEDGSGEITIAELQHYMIKNNYKPTFVSKWLKLFDVDNSGAITYKHYCDTLGLVPKRRESVTIPMPIVNNNDEKLDTKKDLEKDENELHYHEIPCSSEILSVTSIEVISNSTEQIDSTLDEIPKIQPTLEAFERKLKNRKKNSKKVKKDNTPKENVYNFIENNDVEMEENVVRIHSNELNSEEKQNENVDIVPEIVKELAANVDNYVTMEGKAGKKQTKKNNSNVKQTIPKSKTDKPPKDDTPQILKSTVALKPSKEEEIIKNTTNANEESVVKLYATTLKHQSRSPKSYPIQIKKKAPRHRKTLFSKHKRNLRSSIEPGVILILLAGSHKGKRVVFLKQLASGLLLVTGPFKLNGCPLRRVHQKMVIATKTRIDISKVDVPEHINDAYFCHGDKKQASSDVSNIFAKTKTEYALKEVRKLDQANVDKQMIREIKARDDKTTMIKYLKSMFSLSAHDCPHKMMF